MTEERNIRFTSIMGFILACLICVLALSACGESAQASDGSSDDTSGDPFTAPAEIELSSFNTAAATSSNNASIDTSSASKGYVGAAATSSSRLKLQVTKDGQSMHYDMPSDGTPIVVPLDMGSGTYTIAVMQNTSGSRYVELYSTGVNAQLDSEQAPYLVPNIFCNYDASSAVVAKAQELTRDAKNEGDALRLIYSWIDGSWKTVSFTVNPRDWTRVDLTFAANGAGSTVGDGNNYTDRYVY